MNFLIVGLCCILLMLIIIKLNLVINNRGMIFNISVVKVIGIFFKIWNIFIKLLFFVVCLFGVVDFLFLNCRKKVERNNKVYVVIEKVYMYCKFIIIKRILFSEVFVIWVIVLIFICILFICNNLCLCMMSGIIDCNVGK